jgi:hypothetical protein
VDRSRPTTSDRVIGSSAVALFVCSFLPWFGYAKEFSRDGWHYILFGIVPLFIGMAMLAAVIVSRFTARRSGLRVKLARAYLIAGCLAPLLILLKLLTGDKVNVVIRSISLDREFGLYLAFLFALGLTVGGILKSKE